MRQGVNVLYRSEGGAYRRDVEVDEPDSRRRNLRGQELLALCSKCAVMCLRKTGELGWKGRITYAVPSCMYGLGLGKYLYIYFLLESSGDND